MCKGLAEVLISQAASQLQGTLIKLQQRSPSAKLAGKPDMLRSVQVGEFYEAMGTDAVVLVQWAGLNPMGSTHMPPRAGCPHMNIRRTLQSLVEEANLSVVCTPASPVSLPLQAEWCYRHLGLWQGNAL